MFAIIEMSGTQYKVSTGDKVTVDKLDAKENEKIKIDTVLLIQGEKAADLKIGEPYVKGALVEAKVLKQFKGDKVRIFKKKAKKRFQKTRGFRADLTEIEITSIK